jgi:acetyl-CoA C-acetyltransferase
VDALPGREVAVDHEGPATLESYTVMFGADGPTAAHAACLLEDGRRTWANSEDAELMDALMSEEFCGRKLALDGRGGFVPR